MGKGTIISGGTDGQYQIRLNYGRVGFSSKVTSLEKQRDQIDQKIVDAVDAGDDQKEVDRLTLVRLAVQKQIDELQSQMPDDPELSAWCADYTEDLSGEIGTIEVPGEIGTVLIQPGYNGNAVYDATRDGQLLPTMMNSPWQAFFNFAVMSGWQKWMPTARFGVIDSIDRPNDLADITLDDATTSYQDLNINQASKLYDVPIEYMQCNAAAFEEGDNVLIEFTEQDWEQPKVVGFKEGPEPCASGYLVVRTSGHGINAPDWCIVWNMGKNAFATDVVDNSDDPVTAWPVEYDDISDWIDSKTETSTDNLNGIVQTYAGEGGFLTSAPFGQGMSYDDQEPPDDFTCHSGSPCNFATAYQYDEESQGVEGQKGYGQADFIGGRCGNPTGETEYIYDGNTYNTYEHLEIEYIVSGTVYGVKYTALVDGVWIEQVPNLNIEEVQEYYHQKQYYTSYDCFTMQESPFTFTDDFFGGYFSAYWYSKIHWVDPFMGLVEYEPTSSGDGSNSLDWHFTADGIYGNLDCPFSVAIVSKSLLITPQGTFTEPLVDIPLTYYALTQRARSQESYNPANINPYNQTVNEELSAEIQNLVEHVDDSAYPYELDDPDREVIKPALTMVFLEWEET